MLLNELLKEIEIDSIKGNTEIEINHVHFDSRLIKQKSLFIAVDGFRTTGHIYISDAINKGAIAIITEKNIEIDDVVVIRVKNTRKIMAQIANRFYGNPTKQLPLIGVTGTNGKTSITYMIKSILEYHGKNIGLIGTISNWIGHKEIKSSRTTPEALDLQKILSKMVKEKAEACVMEVSSHALALERVEECTYSIGVFTNLTSDHLDFHNNIDNYRNAKKKLFYKTILCNIINVDDFHGRKIVEEIKELKVPLLTYGINEKADISATNISMDVKGVTFDLNTPIGKKRLNVNIPGIFTIYNVMASVIVCYVLGLSLDEIGVALNHVKGVPGRFQIIDEIKKFSVIIDYAHTPDALENILKSTNEFKKNKIITIFGCGGDRDKTKRLIMGQICGELSDYSIITSDNPRGENPLDIINMIEAGIKQVTDQYEIIEDRRCAIESAIKMAEEDDIIIIAGKGHEVTQTIGKDVIPFDDSKVALEIARREGLV